MCFDPLRFIQWFNDLVGLCLVGGGVLFSKRALPPIMLLPGTGCRRVRSNAGHSDCAGGSFGAIQLYPRLWSKTFPKGTFGNVFSVSDVSETEYSKICRCCRFWNLSTISFEGNCEIFQNLQMLQILEGSPYTDHSDTTYLRQRPYCVEYTRSHPNSEVKQRKARSVLGWGTAWEVLRVLLAFCGGFCNFELDWHWVRTRRLLRNAT